jgi:hypothetical protein
MALAAAVSLASATATATAADAAGAPATASLREDCAAGAVVARLANRGATPVDFLVEMLYPASYQAEKVSLPQATVREVVLPVPAGEAPTVQVSVDSVVLAKLRFSPALCDPKPPH